MAVDRKDKPDEIARALVGRLHRDLRKRGVKQVSTRYATAALAPLLQPLGYRSERGGGVAMIALENLPQFFREIAPLLSRRAVETTWGGTIAVCGERHRAALKIDRGEVIVLPRVPARPDIRLSGSDGTIARIVTGIETPFEAHLQLDLQAEPMLTERTQTMLEKLWPRLEVHAWLW